MKMVILLSIACFASLLGCSSAQTISPLLAMANAPIHEAITNLKNIVTAWLEKSPFLQSIDIGHLLEKLFSLTEDKVKDLLFNTILPWIMEGLKAPGQQIRDLLIKVRNFVDNLDITALATNLPTYRKTLDNYIDMVVKSIDQVTGGGRIDIKALDKLNNQTTTKQPLPVLPVVTTTVKSSPWWG